jgi:hypothetical protein
MKEAIETEVIYFLTLRCVLSLTIGKFRIRKNFHGIQLEIEFMLEFISDCQYHHVPIFAFHGYKIFVRRQRLRIQRGKISVSTVK